MPRKGSCRARCPDCGATETIPWKDFARRTRPRCGGCGGLLEPSEPKRKLAARGRDRFNRENEK